MDLSKFLIKDEDNKIVGARSIVAVGQIYEWVDSEPRFDVEVIHINKSRALYFATLSNTTDMRVTLEGFPLYPRETGLAGWSLKKQCKARPGQIWGIVYHQSQNVGMYFLDKVEGETALTSSGYLVLRDGVIQTQDNQTLFLIREADQCSEQPSSEPKKEEPKKILQRPGQTWVFNKDLTLFGELVFFKGQEFQIVDNFGVKTWTIKPVIGGERPLRDIAIEEYCSLISGPTTPETAKEIFERGIRRESKNPPEGISETAFFRALFGYFTMEEKLKGVLKRVRKTSDLAAERASFMEDECSWPTREDIRKSAEYLRTVSREYWERWSSDR